MLHPSCLFLKNYVVFSLMVGADIYLTKQNIRYDSVMIIKLYTFFGIAN